MEKLEKKKHDHKLTSWLRFGIFAVVMLAPFFSVLSKCIYVAVNKNAKESYYGQTINETIKKDGYKNNTEYYTLRTYDIENIQGEISYIITNLNVEGTNPITTDNEEEVIELFFYNYQNTYYCRIKYNDGTPLQYWTYKNTQYQDTIFKFYLVAEPTEQAKQYLSYFEYNKNSYLSNAFEYAIEDLENSNIYNWSKQTGIYTAINNMVEGLGASNILGMLLAYWGILTAIYIVFDIVIECFTKLTHLLAD